jgi:hypothetical protein
MKKLFRIALWMVPLLCSLALGQGVVASPKVVKSPGIVVSPGSASGGSIAVVQTQFCTTSAAGASPFTCQFTTQNNTAGNAIDVHIFAASSLGTFTSISDGGDTCALIGSTQTSGGTVSGQQGYCKNITGGSKKTVSFAYGTTSFAKVAIYLVELSGVSTTTPIDNYTAGTPGDGWNNAFASGVTAGTVITTGNITGVTANDFYSGSVWDQNDAGGTMTPQGSYTSTGCTGCSTGTADQTYNQSFTPISHVIASAGTSAITWKDSTGSAPITLGAAYQP